MIYRKDISIFQQQLGFKNKVILFFCAKDFLFPFRFLLSVIFHLEIPGYFYSRKVRMPHPYNIIVNERAIVGSNVTIYQGVTIGSKQFGSKVGVPEIADDVIIYPNSIIVGAIKVGAGAVIGAGSVVVNDVPDNAIVTGNPARIVSYIVDND